MDSNLESQLTKLRGGTIFYDHITNLSTEDDCCLRLESKKFPQLCLRLPTADDAEALLRCFTDQRNVQYDKSCDGLDNPDAIAKLIREWQKPAQPLKRVNTVVVVDDKVVGVSGFGWIWKRTEDGRMIASAGLMLDSNVRRQGYAYEALSIVVDHGLRVLGLDAVHIACVDANVAFKGLMNEKFGFEAAPISKDHFGNDWIWRITKKLWYASRHSAEGREKFV